MITTRTTTRATTRARVTAALLLALTATTALGPAASAAVAEPGSAEPSTFLVGVAPGQLDELTEDLPGTGVRVLRELEGIGMAVVEATPRAATDLGRDPRVTAVTPDSPVRLLADSYAPYDAKADANSMFNVTDTVGARDMWRDTAGRVRWTGAGVDIAVLDSGISPVEGLATPGKIVNGPDLSFNSQRDNTRYLDAFGHGTHMAGIIAGKDTGADPAANDAASFMGVAPDARLVNVKVADALGSADVSQIVAGIDWVVQNRRAHGLNIRVLNLSLGTPSRQSYLTDPLAYAAEQAWHKGIVVVAATGNDGTGTGKLLNPAQDPYVLAVGANDSRNTIPTDNDVIPAFSTRGDGVRNPDVVAHGVSVQSLRVPGSFIDQEFGAGGAINQRFMRGSGTSQAAAVTSGAVALLLQRNPAWTPEDVKARLLAGARTLPAADRQAQGKGMLDLRRVSTSATFAFAPQAFTKAKGTGSLDEARGGYRLTTDQGVVLDGERDIFGKAYDAGKQAALSASDTAWTGGTWNGTEWTGSALTSTGWAATTWSGTDWAGTAWTNQTWTNATWTNATWTNQTWTNATWTNATWTNQTWTNQTWTNQTWTSAGWN